MRKMILPAAVLMTLTACGNAGAIVEEPMAAEEMTDPGSADSAAAVDFGDDMGEWANDGECDDPRFAGPGMTATPLLDEDIRHDATDCRTAFEAGNLQLRD